MKITLLDDKTAALNTPLLSTNDTLASVHVPAVTTQTGIAQPHSRLETVKEGIGIALAAFYAGIMFAGSSVIYSTNMLDARHNVQAVVYENVFLAMMIAGAALSLLIGIFTGKKRQYQKLHGITPEPISSTVTNPLVMFTECQAATVALANDLAGSTFFPSVLATTSALALPIIGLHLANTGGFHTMPPLYDKQNWLARRLPDWCHKFPQTLRNLLPRLSQTYLNGLLASFAAVGYVDLMSLLFSSNPLNTSTVIIITLAVGLPYIISTILCNLALLRSRIKPQFPQYLLAAQHGLAIGTLGAVQSLEVLLYIGVLASQQSSFNPSLGSIIAFTAASALIGCTGGIMAAKKMLTVIRDTNVAEAIKAMLEAGVISASDPEEANKTPTKISIMNSAKLFFFGGPENTREKRAQIIELGERGAEQPSPAVLIHHALEAYHKASAIALTQRRMLG